MTIFSAPKELRLKGGRLPNKATISPNGPKNPQESLLDLIGEPTPPSLAPLKYRT